MRNKYKLPEIVINTNGVIGTVIVDGIDMSDKITAYEIRHEGGKLPELILKLCGENMTVNGAMVPALPEVFKPYYKPNFSEE